MKTLSFPRLTRVAIAIIFSSHVAQPCALARAKQANQEKEQKRHIILAHSPKAIPELRMIRMQGIEGEDWLNEFELEYKNFSEKPIYYICIYVILPETGPYGGTAGFRLEFGNPEFSHISRYATTEDVALKPGESHVFKINKEHIKNHWDYLEHWTGQKGFSPVITKVEVDLYRVSFGDGTTYVAGELLPRKNRN
ncbi:MAG: hypothetical protein HYR56_32675 [Acidobacteria bacterium]|nr:hypothetical protein [Acidobacteriota bacterium]MBI3426124.1 hypothetical protein [Acidobacteriota bacterium]